MGIGTSSPDTSSLLEIRSSNKGFLLPRLTTVQVNAIANLVPIGWKELKLNSLWPNKFGNGNNGAAPMTRKVYMQFKIYFELILITGTIISSRLTPPC